MRITLHSSFRPRRRCARGRLIAHIASYRLADGRAIDLAPTAVAPCAGAGGRQLPASSAKKAGGTCRTLGWTDQPDWSSRNTRRPATRRRSTSTAMRGTRIPLEVAEPASPWSGAGTRRGDCCCRPANPECLSWCWCAAPSSHRVAICSRLQRQLPAAGIGAFVYDKRGTGRFQRNLHARLSTPRRGRSGRGARARRPLARGRRARGCRG